MRQNGGMGLNGVEVLLAADHRAVDDNDICNDDAARVGLCCLNFVSVGRCMCCVMREERLPSVSYSQIAGG